MHHRQARRKLTPGRVRSGRRSGLQALPGELPCPVRPPNRNPDSNRFPYLDPLNHLQVELLKRYRAGDSADKVHRGIHLTINGLAAGLRNSG